MARRFTSLLAASMFPAVILLATACSSNAPATSSSAPSATASQSAALTDQQVLPLFFQCLTEHNVPIRDKDQGDTNLASLGKKEGWYINGRVVANNALYSDSESLEGFYPISPDFEPEQTIATWVDNAASTGTWPKVCGPLPKAT